MTCQGPTESRKNRTLNPNSISTIVTHTLYSENVLRDAHVACFLRIM